MMGAKSHPSRRLEDQGKLPEEVAVLWVTRTCDRQTLAHEQPVQAPEARPAAVLVEGLHVWAADTLLRRGPHDLGEEVLKIKVTTTALFAPRQPRLKTRSVA